MSGKAIVGGRGRKASTASVKAKAEKNGKETDTKIEVLKNIAPPSNLNEVGAKMWQMIIRQLTSQQVLYTTDTVVLENFCIAYQNRILAQKGIDDYGLYISSANGSLAKNPAFTILNESLRQLATFGAMLGLDPASRQRVIATVDKVEENPFADLLKTING